MKKNNFYVFTGGPSSGKTTVLKLLEEKGFLTSYEPARIFIEEQIRKGKEASEIRKNELEFQLKILTLNIQREKQFSSDEIVFMDRAIPDSFAYIKHAGGNSKKLIKKMNGKLSYKQVFLFRMLPFVKDHARVENHRQAKQIEKLLIETYNRVGLRPIIVPVMSPRKRLKFILNHMKEDKKITDYTYTSVFSWRYGSEEMRQIFSEKNKYILWRKIWVSLARAQRRAGLLSKQELDDLIRNQNKINISRILQLEKQTNHDVVAAIKEFAETAKKGGGKIHLGATSYDIVDNASTMQIKQALDNVEKNVVQTLKLFNKLIGKYADVACMGFTHLQPAEPTTVGYRLAFYAQDFLIDLELLRFVKTQLKAKGIKGAVGTSASYEKILEGKKMSSAQLEDKVMNDLDLNPFLVSSQVSTKKIDYLVLSVLNSIASSSAKFANDLRIMQSPAYGEWSEPFGKNQVGSSAMPFKRNPIRSEKITSLARYVSTLPQVALGNATHSYLERTLDDSANRRIIFPDAFLPTDEILLTLSKILDGFQIHSKRIEYNLSLYGPFSSTENIIIELVKKGFDRQKAHELLRTISMKAWEEIQDGKLNPIQVLLKEDSTVSKYLTEKELKKMLDVTKHTGTAKKRSLQLVKKIKKSL